jgi:hypothetical protein
VSDTYFKDPEPTLPTEKPYFSDENAPAPVGADLIKARATKFHLGMGESSPGMEVLQNNMQTGREHLDRYKAAADEAVKVEALKLQIMEGMAKDQKGPVTPAQQEFVLGLSKQNIINPDTIVERQYARKSVPGALLAGDSRVMDRGLNEAPDATDEAMDIGEDLVARTEVFRKINEETQATYAAANPIVKIASHLETWIPGVPQAIYHTADENLDSYSILTGSIKEDFVNQLYTMPLDQAQKTLKSTVDSLMLTNPLMATQLTEAVLSYSSSAKNIDNVFAVLDAASVVPIGATIKGAKAGVAFAKEVKAVKSAAKNPSSVRAALRNKETGEIHSGTNHGSIVDNLVSKEGRGEEGVTEELIDAGTFEEGFVSDGKFLSRDETNQRFGFSSTEDQQLAGREAVQAVKDVVKAHTQRVVEPVEILSAAGHTEQAAVQGAVREQLTKLTQGLNPTGTGGETVKLLDNAPALFKASSWATQEAKGLSLETQRRLVDRLEETTPSMMRAINEGIRIDQLSEEQLVPAALEVLARTKREYPEVADNILATTRHEYSPQTNTHFINVQIGDEGGALFKSKEAAFQTADLFGLKGYKIRAQQQGSGFYLEIPQPVDNSAPLIRSTPLDTDNLTPRSAFSAVFGWLRSPADTLSRESNADRVAAVYGPGGLKALVQPSANRITDLSQGTRLGNFVRERVGIPTKKERAELYEFIEADKLSESLSPDGITEVGRSASNWAELWTRWHEKFGKYPSEKQMLAYAEAVRINDLDWVLNNFSIYAGKTRKGVKSHTFGVKMTGPQGEQAFETMANIEAKNVDALPTEGDAGVLILRDSGSQFVRLSEMTQTQRELVTHLTERDGHRIFQVPGFGSDNLKRSRLVGELTGEDNIHFVVSNRYEIKPLSLKQLPKRPGFHIEYPDGWYTSQANITKIERALGTENRYDGDKNVWQFTNHAKGKKFTDALEHVRVSLRNGTTDGLDEFIAKNLPKTPEIIKGMFYPKLDSGGKIIENAALSLDESIGLRFAGESLADKQALAGKYANFKDGRKDPYNLYSDVNFEYAGKRNPIIDTIEETGTETNPIFNTRPSKTVDVMTTMNRAMSKIIESRYLNDLKGKEIDKFVREFGDELDVDPKELALNPVPHVMNPKWKTSGTQLDELNKHSAARQSNTALRQFLGTSTKFSNYLRVAKQKLADSLYTTGTLDTVSGVARAIRGKEVVEPWLLSTTNDPFSYFRSLAFHTKLGLFNPVQIFLQGQGFVHVAAVAGIPTAIKAGAGFSIMRFLRFTTDPKIISDAAKKAVKHGWKEDEFIEAYHALRESGMERVGGEVAMLDHVDPSLMTTASGTFAKWSTAFFTEGERFVRMSAHNAAYLEWRAANPTAKFTNKVAKQVLARADLMSVNMTRASSASWQRGFASIPTQFFSYQARLMEQMVGQRLTVPEKLRAFTFYSALYGLPVGVSSTVGVWPWGDEIRKDLQARGIDYDDDIPSRIMWDGMLSAGLQAMTGTKYNVGGRYGPNGIQAFRDFLKTDEGSKLLLGVSGTVIFDMLKAVDPVAGDIALAFRGDQGAIPLLVSDLANASDEFSTGKQAWAMYTGINAHKYISKNDMYTDDVNAIEATFMGLAGLTPQRINDAYYQNEILKDRKALVAEAAKKATKDMRKGLASEDPAEALALITRGKAAIEVADMDENERSRTMSQVLQGYESFVNMKGAEFARTSEARLQKYLNERKRAQQK